MTNQLEYSIPKNVPKWVEGFSKYLTAEGLTDPKINDMATTWQTYQTSHWVNFQALGKKRGTKVIKEKKPKDETKSRVRQRLKDLKLIADTMGSEEMNQIVKDLQLLLEA